MKGKKILSCALAIMLSLGTLTVLPAKFDSNIDIAVTADAASDFVIETDDESGEKYIVEYTGKGGAVTLPKGVNVDYAVFYGNDTITSITVPGDCIFYDYAFANCKNLEKVTVKGNAFFGPASFIHCINLKSVTVEGSLLDICGSAFAFCHSLKTFSVKENKKEFAIGTTAFYCCYSLESMAIPSKCTEIYAEAFLNCFNLSKLTVPAGTKFNYNAGKYQMGYFDAAKTYDDACDGNWYTAVADGKTSVYCDYINTSTGTYMDSGLFCDYKKYTPKKLTMTVTKGSDAEKYAKENKIAYKYASSSSSSDKLAAPENIKASKTSSSVTLTWDKVSGADAYKVWKLNEKTGKYEKYKIVTAAKCTISDLDKNTKYSFKITSLDKVDGKYKSGSTSKAVSVTTKK
ncbi:MAG: leucine-rich repeat protein [Oscillospiraceae bacterium]